METSTKRPKLTALAVPTLPPGRHWDGQGLHLVPPDRKIDSLDARFGHRIRRFQAAHDDQVRCWFVAYHAAQQAVGESSQYTDRLP